MIKYGARQRSELRYAAGMPSSTRNASLIVTTCAVPEVLPAR
uniref:Uncharacterized protein n=1 Tax=Nonomuraea gerenzanensis TaxID=93944 RepID=A0A1M4EDQ5_9ACTN|nr:hypothetical protein BN4615_P6324 [Nonomuraea gerenzanensis]